MPRLFVAAFPPPEAARALARAQDEWRRRLDARRLRFVAEPAIHLTLCFLGDRSPEETAAASAALADLGAHHPILRLALDRAGCFPDPRRPRVLWHGLGGDVDPLLALQRDVQGRLERAVGLAPDGRAFVPHVTLARAKGPVRVPEDAPAEVEAAVHGTPWTLDAVALVASRLGPAGPRYDVLSRVLLGSSRAR